MNKKLIKAMNVLEWSADPDDPAVSGAIKAISEALEERERLLGAGKLFVEESLYHDNAEPPVWFCEWCCYSDADKDAIPHGPGCPVGRVLGIIGKEEAPCVE